MFDLLCGFEYRIRFEFTARKQGFELIGFGKKAHGRIAAEYLEPARIHGTHHQPCGWQNRYPSVLLALHLEQNHGTEHQGNRRQHLIGNTEQWPEHIDAAQRIVHTHVQEVAPRGDHNARCQQVRRQRMGLFQTWIDQTEQVLQHKPCRTRTRIHRRQNKQGFKQNRKVIPE